jgi:biliverdin reductase
MIRVGIVGTGFVAQKRGAAIARHERAQVVAVAGLTWAETVAFAQQYDAEPVDHWSDLVAIPDVDLVMVCHVNQGHGPVTQAALEANKSVVVEYPLALDLAQAEHSLTLARNRQVLLHVAHGELLSGSHRALRATLPEIGPVHYARYCTLAPKRSRLNHWTYNPQLFGFPLVGALSRIHRLVDCFGPVVRVYCQNHYSHLEHLNGAGTRHRGCLCTADLTFASGTIAEVVYGKGEAIWATVRSLAVFGERGGLVFDGDRGECLTSQGSEPVPLGSRRGLFAEDTMRVLNHLLDGSPLYCSAEDSFYSLRVAAAAEASAFSGQAVAVAEVEA